METRRFSDSEGKLWEAYAADAVVAHGRVGAALAFRPADGDGEEELRSNITFNSVSAAEFALRTLAEKELRRRLSLARMAVGGV